MKSWEVEEGAWKQERGAGTHAPCTGLQGVNFPELRAGGQQEDNAGWGGGLTGPLHMYSLCDTWDATRGPAQPSKVVSNPTPSFLDPKAL